MGDFVKHVGCECGSSDGVAVYQKEENGEIFYDGTCFVCGKYYPKGEIDPNTTVEKTKEPFDPEPIQNLPMRGWKERRVGKTVSEFYGVHTEMDAQENVTKRYYPITKNSSVVGYKMRDCTEKDFRVFGNGSNGNEMFGQHLFSSGGKHLIICSGEEDAMSMQQAMWGKNPNYTTAIISPINGEKSVTNQIKANFDWVTSFEKVTLVFDSDDVGKEEAQRAAKVLKPGQAHIATMNLKDANEYVMARRDNELVAAFWKAERFSPIELMTLGQMWDDFEQGAEHSIVPFPEQFQSLNYMLGGGVAVGEVTLVAAQTSVGKSSIINNLVYSFMSDAFNKIGLLYLESTPREIVQNLLSIHMEDNLSLKNPSTFNMTELKKRFFEMVEEEDRIISIDHQGAFSSIDELFHKLEWMVKAMGTNIVVVDPIHAAVPSNENSQLDEFMDRCLKLAKQTDCTIFVVSHVKKPDSSDPHEISEYSTKGSGSLNQIAFNTILLSRDKMAEDEKVRNSTKIQVAKCRRTGFTGEAGWLRFDPDRAKMYACNNPYAEAQEEEDQGPMNNFGVGETKEGEAF